MFLTVERVGGTHTTKELYQLVQRSDVKELYPYRIQYLNGKEDVKIDHGQVSVKPSDVSESQVYLAIITGERTNGTFTSGDRTKIYERAYEIVEEDQSATVRVFSLHSYPKIQQNVIFTITYGNMTYYAQSISFEPKIDINGPTKHGMNPRIVDSILLD